MPQEELSTLIASGLAPGHRCGLGTDRKHLWLQLPPGDCHSGAQAVVRWQFQAEPAKKVLNAAQHLWDLEGGRKISGVPVRR